MTTIRKIVSVRCTLKTIQALGFYKRSRFSEPFKHQNRYRVPTPFVENRILDHFLRFGEPTPFLAIAIHLK